MIKIDKSNRMPVAGISALFFLAFSVLTLIIRWENKHTYYEDNWVEYEVVWHDDNEVMLYRSDLSDSIHISLEAPVCLTSEQVIFINKPILHYGNP